MKRSCYCGEPRKGDAGKELVLCGWVDSRRDHGGVIFVDRSTLEPSDVGGLLRALLKLWETLGQVDWQDLVAHLRREP